jgi:hypothetical protein
VANVRLYDSSVIDAGGNSSGRAGQVRGDSACPFAINHVTRAQR